MQITLKNVRHYPSMSEETECFEATVYIDGKKAGEVVNRGQGGAHEMGRDLYTRLSEYAKTLPIREVTCGGQQYSFPPDAEGLIDDALSAFLKAKDEVRFEKMARKDLSTRLVFLRDGKLLQTKKLPAATLLEAVQHYVKKGETVLNALPFAEAYPIWRQFAVREG